MKNLNSLGLRVEQNRLFVLNQQKLPAQEEWLECKTPQDMFEMIQTLKVRGAPLIGVSAAMALAQFAEQCSDADDIQEAATLLKSARPTAVNLAHCIDRQLRAFSQTSDREAIIQMAEDLFVEDAILCEKMADYGAQFISPGDNVLTHCNTGGLVTTGIGTALGVIIHAHNQQKNIHVYVDETRPLLQGARLTAWELQRAQVPCTLICDNMAASLMRKNKIQGIFVGSDRIAANGDVANKIGTYNLAVLAKHHGVPFYVVAPYTTFDPDCSTGDDIVIEERMSAEVRGFHVGDAAISWSPDGCSVYNPAFDVTPAALVTAYIFDYGVVHHFDEKHEKTTMHAEEACAIQ